MNKWTGPLLAVVAAALVWWWFRRRNPTPGAVPSRTNDATWRATNIGEDRLDNSSAVGGNKGTASGNTSTQGRAFGRVFGYIGTANELPFYTVCVPKFNTESHKDGRSPYHVEDPSTCGKPRDVRGMLIRVSNGPPVFFAWTQDPYCFNYHRIKDRDPDVAYFVSHTEDGNMRAAYNFRTKQWLRRDEVVVEENPAGHGGYSSDEHNWSVQHPTGNPRVPFKENYRRERNNFLDHRHTVPDLGLAAMPGEA